MCKHEFMERKLKHLTEEYWSLTEYWSGEYTKFWKLQEEEEEEEEVGGYDGDDEE